MYVTLGSINYSKALQEKFENGEYSKEQREFLENVLSELKFTVDNYHVKELLINGSEPVKVGDKERIYINANSMYNIYDRMVEKGVIDSAKAEENLENDDKYGKLGQLSIQLEG